MQMRPKQERKHRDPVMPEWFMTRSEKIRREDRDLVANSCDFSISGCCLLLLLVIVSFSNGCYLPTRRSKYL